MDLLDLMNMSLKVNSYPFNLNIDTKDTAEGGGASMKYTLMTIFSVNLLLKLVISSSAALMWSLIHVLQAFRYILLVNIKMPLLIGVLMKYMGVVVGEVDEIDSIIPDLVNTYVINSTDISPTSILYERFEENGMLN